MRKNNNKKKKRERTFGREKCKTPPNLRRGDVQERPPPGDVDEEVNE